MSDKEIEVVLKVKISTSLENIKENTEETVRFLVEEDLQNLGYAVEFVEMVNE